MYSYAVSDLGIWPFQDTDTLHSMLRIWALYGRSRTILIFFSVIAVLGTGGGLAILQLNPPVSLRPIDISLSFLLSLDLCSCSRFTMSQFPMSV